MRSVIQPRYCWRGLQAARLRRKATEKRRKKARLRCRCRAFAAAPVQLQSSRLFGRMAGRCDVKWGESSTSSATAGSRGQQCFCFVSMGEGVGVGKGIREVEIRPCKSKVVTHLFPSLVSNTTNIKSSERRLYHYHHHHHHYLYPPFQTHTQSTIAIMVKAGTYFLSTDPMEHWNGAWSEHV